jgi:hypothetical protein
MKKLNCILFASLICLTNIYPQTYKGGYDNLFLNQQVNAQAEAMGEGHATMYGSPFSAFYNPASSAFSSGLNAEVSHLDPNNIYDSRPYYNSYGISYNSDKYGAISLNEIYYTANENYTYYYSYPWNNYYYGQLQHTPTMQLYLLNYSYMICEGFSAGLNIDYLRSDAGYAKYNAALVDIGFMKKFQIKTNSADHDFYLGLSCSNITNAKLKSSDIKSSYEYDNKSTFAETAPSIMRVGGSYEFSPEMKVADFHVIKTLFAVDYRDVLNYKYDDAIQFGSEFTFFDILKIRAGYYTQSVNSYNSPYLKDRINSFTYGFGIDIPISKFYKCNRPVSLQFDFARIQNPESSYYAETYDYRDYDYENGSYDSQTDYSVYSLKLKIGL